MQTVLLLHGAAGASKQLLPIVAKLGGHYDVHMMDFSGHGGMPFGTDDFSIKSFADEVLRYMKLHELEQTSIFGYSMGGYVAIYLARYHPEKIERVVTLATKFHWDPAIAAAEIRMLDAEKIEQKLPAFANTLKQRHAPNDWKELLARTAKMLKGLGEYNTLSEDDYRAISAPVMLLAGDRDKMVAIGETEVVYRALPNARMGVLPNTPHPIEQVDHGLLASLVHDFFSK